MITDEMAKKALNAYWQCRSKDLYDHMRAALEAVAPMLIADYQQSLNALGDAYDQQIEKFAEQRSKLIAIGLREAAKTCDQYDVTGLKVICRDAILARAQELDPQ